MNIASSVPYKWGKIINDCVGWDLRIWPLAVSMGWPEKEKKKV